jgi:uncharacterized membrane protein/mono/diheme cytochrome c family protein
MQVLTISQFIGHFHPVLVHLPIGILVLGGLFHLLSARNRYAFLRPAVGIIYLLGAVGAIVSCISGYLLSQTSDYDANLVALHQWLGIGVAVVALLLYVLLRFHVNELLLRFLTVIILIGITVTGHYGGSLTHGSDYLFSALTEGVSSEAAIPLVANIQQAKVYPQLVEPLLKNRCYNCHGAEKQKGKLRVDSKEFMVKGGESGSSLVAGKADESELVKRLLLPLDNEDHMPPKEKPQLSEEEIALLKWWVSQGADIHKTVEALKPNLEMNAVLSVFQSGAIRPKEAKNSLLDKEVEEADAEALKKLKDAGVVVLPLHQTSNYLSVNFVTTDVTPALLGELKKLNKQLVYLELAYTSLNDEGMMALSSLNNLLQLNLRGTSITDKGLTYLKDLKQLTLLNLVETKVSAEGVSQLKALKSLESIYLYKTTVDKQGLASLKTLFPNSSLDTGGYHVPTLASDTTVVKAP